MFGPSRDETPKLRRYCDRGGALCCRSISEKLKIPVMVAELPVNNVARDEVAPMRKYGNKYDATRSAIGGRSAFSRLIITNEPTLSDRSDWRQ